VIKEIQVTGKIRDMIEFTRDYQSLGVKSPTWQNVYEVCVRILPLTDMISVDLPPSDLEIFADPLLEKVFYTLYDNAVRHGEHVTGMSIRCHEKEAQLTIVVEDNGAGVAPDMKGKIFQRGVGKHTGLGLFLARQILSLTGITIEETGEPGKGARFEIHVPAGVYRYIRAQ
jgi:signal transduction histidine kinase